MDGVTEASTWVTTYIPLGSTVVVAIATVVLVRLTSKYVRLTNQMVDDMKQTREPSITVDFELVDHALRLAVGNSGLTPAKDIRFDVRQDIDWLRSGGDTTGIADLAPLKRGISYLAPGRTLKYLAGFPNRQNAGTGNMLLSIDVEFSNEHGATFEHGIDIDMTHYESVLFESFKEPERAIADAIKDVERSRRTQSSSSGLVQMFRRQNHTRCPIFGEEIKVKAKKCRHCGEWLPDKAEEDIGDGDNLALEQGVQPDATEE